MSETFDSIHQRGFPQINFLSKLEWNWWGRCPASGFNCYSAEVIEVDDSEDIPYSQQYLVVTSTRSRAYLCPPKETQSPKTMSIWNFSRYWCFFLMGFTLGGFTMVTKEPKVDGRRPEFIRLALVAELRCFLLRNFLQPNMRWRFRVLNCVWFLHGASVDYGGIKGRLVASIWTILRVRM